MAVDNSQEIVVRATSSLCYSLKPEQEQAIFAFVSGNDVFIALPTGYGKSLCFVVLTRAFDLLREVQNEWLVVALMRDQAASFTAATPEIESARLHLVALHNNYILLAQLVLRKVPRPSASREGLARETR